MQSSETQQPLLVNNFERYIIINLLCIFFMISAMNACFYISPSSVFKHPPDAWRFIPLVRVFYGRRHRLARALSRRVYENFPSLSGIKSE
jgi:hypothetical protein